MNKDEIAIDIINKRAEILKIKNNEVCINCKYIGLIKSIDKSQIMRFDAK